MALGGDQTRTVRVVFKATDEGVGAMVSKIDDRVESVKGGFISAAKAADQWGDTTKRAAQSGSSGMSRFSASARDATSQVRTLTKAGRNLVSNLKDVGLLGLGFSTIASAAREAVDAVLEFADASVEAQQLTNGLQIDIDGARGAFKGYVNDLDLARAANQAFTTGVVKSGEEFATLAAGVQAKAEQLGVPAAKLLEQATIGIARKSAARLDDLGIIISQTKAERIYAESLNKTAKELTALEKEEAFAKAVLIDLGKAAAQSTVEIEGFAVKVVRTRVEVENLKAGLLGFDDVGGKVNEALRSMSESQLKFIASSVGYADVSTRMFKANRLLAEWGVTMEDVVKKAADLNVEVSQLTRGQAEKRQIDAANAARAEQVAIMEDQAAILVEQAVELERINELARASGDAEEFLVARQERSLELRIRAAQATRDEAKGIALSHELEVLRAKASAPKSRGGGRGATGADRLAAAGELRVANLEHQAQLMGIIAGTSAQIADAEDAATSAAVTRLELEQDVLDLTRARGRVAKAELESSKAAVAAEIGIVQLESRVRLHEREVVAIAEATELELKRASNAQGAGARVIDLAQFRLRSQATELTNAGRLGEASIIRVKLIESETSAARARFELREQELRAIDPDGELARLEQADQLQQLVHDREMFRLTTDGDMRRELDAEKQRLAEADAERLRVQREQIGQWVATATTAQAEVTKFATFMINRRNERDDATHQAQVDRLGDQAAARNESFDRQITAAKGNAALTAKLTRDKANVDAALQKQIEDAEAQHQEKRKRQEMRFQGALLLVQGAVQTAKAAAAYPVIPSMIAHGIAAGINFAMGASLLAGTIPGGGGASSSAVGGAGAGAGRVERDTTEAPTTPESVAASDRGGQGAASAGAGVQTGGHVVNIENFQMLGQPDEETAEKFAVAMDNARLGRESVGP